MAGALTLQGCTTNQNSDQKPLPDLVAQREAWQREVVDQNLAVERLTDEEILEQARDRIEKYRKSDLHIRVVDFEGHPVTGLPLELVQVQSSFDWGCSGALELDEANYDPVRQKVTRHFTRLYNTTTAKCYWDEKWHHPIEHEEGKRVTRFFEQEVQWAMANGLRVKGHPLVWTVRKAIPRWMDRYSLKEQMKHLENHVKSMVALGGSWVNRWDLCNEMLWEPSLRNLPRRKWPHLEEINEILTYLEPAIHWAREVNPNAIYSLNDYGLVQDSPNAGGRVTAKQQRMRYVALVEEMKLRGCAPNAIGVQAHVGGWYTPGSFRQCLDDLSQPGVPLQVTEFWARGKNNPALRGKSQAEIENARANYAGNLYTVAFGHPAVTHFTYWGGGGIDRQTGDTLPLYHTIYELVQRRWRTNGSFPTNQEGMLVARAFHGTYYLRYRDKRGNPGIVSFEVSPFQENNLLVQVDV